jgi:crotonobetainyl-CoA:carnitine CoA-transferase CaiB-like acyl-CoA transferase
MSSRSESASASDPDDVRPGPLAGLRVVELASEHAAYCGKLLADLGAEVVLVEPPGGHHTRTYEPFVDDIPDRERSLWFWHHNTSKLGVCLDLTSPVDADVFRRLVSRCDVVLEAEPVGRPESLGPGRAPGNRPDIRAGLDATTLRVANPRLIWASVTPFGRSGARSHEQATDLTIMSGGGMLWSCGYDDPTLPPMRGAGGQAANTASVWAAIGILVALEARETTGRGQLIDVSMHAAANVNTEQATHTWLVAKKVVRRQTGRHAASFPTDPVVAADVHGNEVHTGFPPRSTKQLRALVDWLATLGPDDEFPMVALLELAIEQGGIDVAKLLEDALTQEMYRASRDALWHLATRLRGHDFFIQGQERGIPVGVINSPDEAMTDPHVIARGFAKSVFHADLEREVTYPGAPIRFTASPWRISRPAPHVGEHQSVTEV